MTVTRATASAPYGLLPAPLHDHALLPWRFFARFQATETARRG